MAVIGRVRTTVDAVRYLKIEYPWLADAETLEDINITVTPQGNSYDVNLPLNIDSVIFSLDRKYVQFRVFGGEIGGLYTVAFLVTTSSTQTNEDCIEFTVDEGCK